MDSRLVMSECIFLYLLIQASQSLVCNSESDDGDNSQIAHQELTEAKA